MLYGKKKAITMELKNVKHLSFPEASFQKWKEAIEESLKGKSIDRLQTLTSEEIALQPLYTAENSTREEWPGLYPYTRGISATGYREQEWLVCQPVSGTNRGEANRRIQEALKRGQNAISFSADMLPGSIEEASELFNNLLLAEIPVFLDVSGKQNQFFSLLYEYCKQSSIDEAGISGVMAEDLIAEWVVNGKIPEYPELYFERWFSAIKETQERFPDVKTILIKTPVFHNGGANAVQELALALSTAVKYLEEGQKQGLSLFEITSKMVFSFSLDSNYFMGIAKLRAARRLWALLSEAYGAPGDWFKMHIHAVTSEVTETLYDRYVNVLRTAGQAFSAAIGGIQYLQVHPYDHVQGNSGESAERIARNIQNILKEESHITSAADPAGGSWYVEQLTDELSDKAWRKFLQIEQSGGILQGLLTGRIQGEIRDVYEKKRLQVELRKDSLIGTNVYPDPGDFALNPGRIDISYLETDSAFVAIEPIKAVRLSAGFEQLRLRSGKHRQKTGHAPLMGIICLKDQKNHKPRHDFIAALAASGGIEISASAGLHSAEEAASFVKDTNLPVYCLCGSDESYQELGLQLLQEIKREYPEKRMYVAGLQTGDAFEALAAAGADDYLYKGTNAAAILTQLLKELGVNEDDKA
ncbi:heterodimeric methylmalonyl-CoA mutase small subunit [Bacillus sp. OV322]|nr:heterodimeric methylmalonyl-CoA mutase small subunit [Bacillus sp. OV322]